MKNFLTKKTVFLRKLKRFFAVIACLFLVCLLPLFASCKKEIDYFDYVSELRSNIFLAETDGFSLRVYAVEKVLQWGQENGYSFKALDTESPGMHHQIVN